MFQVKMGDKTLRLKFKVRKLSAHQNTSKQFSLKQAQIC